MRVVEGSGGSVEVVEIVKEVAEEVVEVIEARVEAVCGVERWAYVRS